MDATVALMDDAFKLMAASVVLMDAVLALMEAALALKVGASVLVDTLKYLILQSQKIGGGGVV